ncbi:DUF1127 domain-containing protein [Cognatishimia activa]|uniref:DUF1127 domain-containing protein n=1 Tax=Cognatishimia activa TaxID=1715691 RepID=UPI002230EFA1|nr:DUF1127 domain-containing protein [Cognatishimia activa]UZD91392.1 DUF1127 domain-containing protein [Cognatishimia activa]
MATVALQSGVGFSVLRLLMKPFAAIGHFMVVLAESSDRMQRVQALNEMTDEQLAKKGLKREDIVRHIFADHMGL